MDKIKQLIMYLIDQYKGIHEKVPNKSGNSFLWLMIGILYLLILLVLLVSPESFQEIDMVN